MLPKEIGQLQALTHLDLSSNELNTLPKEIGQLQALTHLSLIHNKLTNEQKDKIRVWLPNCEIFFESERKGLQWPHQ